MERWVLLARRLGIGGCKMSHGIWHYNTANGLSFTLICGQLVSVNVMKGSGLLINIAIVNTHQPFPRFVTIHEISIDYYPSSSKKQNVGYKVMPFPRFQVGVCSTNGRSRICINVAGIVPTSWPSCHQHGKSPLPKNRQ